MRSNNTIHGSTRERTAHQPKPVRAKRSSPSLPTASSTQTGDIRLLVGHISHSTIKRYF